MPPELNAEQRDRVQRWLAAMTKTQRQTVSGVIQRKRVGVEPADFIGLDENGNPVCRLRVRDNVEVFAVDKAGKTAYPEYPVIVKNDELAHSEEEAIGLDL